MRHILQICHFAIFFLFLRLQATLKGHRYAENRVIQIAVTKQLQHFSAFHDYFKDPQKHWKRYVNAGALSKEILSTRM
jgi:hypothetical protein